MIGNTAALGTDAPVTDPLTGFELDIRLVSEAIPEHGLVSCNTDDGCGQTCQSACANSNG